jgi:release factor glutamine methyltransferase
MNVIPMKALELLRTAKELLEQSSIEDAAREAETIIAHCLKTDRATLYRDNPQIPRDLAMKIESLVERRAKREPLEYILGYVEFFGLKIKVGQGVLIPRPETEILAEEAIKTVKRKLLGVRKISPHTSRFTSLRFLDLCTGSGCLALSLAKEFPNAQVFGTDTSAIAIQYANENAALNWIRNITFMKGSLFEPVKGLTFDLIVSNPPYIRSNDIKDLQPEIKDWEPQDSLNGGEDGLDYYKFIIPAVKNYLNKGRYLMLEIGINQADAVKDMAEDTGLQDVSLKKDYAGIDRIFIAKNNILEKNNL